MGAYNSLSLLSAELSNTIYTSETIDNIIRDIEGGGGSNLSGIEEKLDGISSQNETINDNVLGLSQERDILARLAELEEKMDRVYGHDQSDDVLAYMISRVNSNTDEVNVHNIPESSSKQVTRVGDYVFKNFKSLVSVDFPNATTIGEEAFRNCISLESVKLSSAQSFGLNAFDGCSALEEINCDSLTSIPNYAFNGCTSLKMLKSDTVETVGTAAFKGCGSLESVKLNHSSNTGLSAFANNVNLTNAEFENATTINNYSFQNCSHLSSVFMPNATTVGQYAFQNDTKLISGDFSSLTNININAFEGNTSLTGLNLTHSVNIGNFAFHNCSSYSQNISCSNTTLGSQAAASNNSREFNNAMTENTSIYCSELTSMCTWHNFSGCGAKRILLPKLQRVAHSVYAGYYNYSQMIGGLNDLKTLSGMYLPSLKYVENNDVQYGLFENSSKLNWIYAPEFIGVSDSDGGLETRMFQNCLNLEYFNMGNKFVGIHQYAFTGITKIKLFNGGSVCWFWAPFGYSNGGTSPFWRSANEYTEIEYVDYRDRIEVLSSTVTYSLTACNNATYQRYSKAYPTGTKFIVPDNLYEDWIQLSGWSDNVDNIIKQSDFEADPNHPEYPWVEDPSILEHYFD